MIQSGREAAAQATCGAPSLGRVGSASLWVVLAWAALMLAIVVSFRPAVPVIWGDTPSFVESALQTLEAGRPTVAGGRDPGYPAFLAGTFALGGDFATVVRLQQVAWAVLILALAATAHAAMRNAAGLVPIILVAMYPGLLLLRNVLTADLLFAVFLNLAMAGLLVATCIGKAARCYAVAASILCAALAACFRSQGILVPIAAIVLGARLARPDTYGRFVVMAVSVAAALALLAVGSRFGASDSDQASVVFVPKTLFCNHLNIELASDAARREIVSAAGDRADATMAQLAADFAADPVTGPCSASSAMRACSTPHWIEISPAVAGTRPPWPRPIGASSWPPCVTGRWPMLPSSPVRWPMGPRRHGRSTAWTLRYRHRPMTRRTCPTFWHGTAARFSRSICKAHRFGSAHCPISQSCPAGCSGHCPPPSLSRSCFGR